VRVATAGFHACAQDIHDSRMRIAFPRELSRPLETPAREERLCIQEFSVALPSVLMHLEAVGSTVACPTRHAGIVGGKSTHCTEVLGGEF
jgi:hypothetical protein